MSRTFDFRSNRHKRQDRRETRDRDHNTDRLSRKSLNKIDPRTPSQKKYLDLIDQHDLVFGLGPAGTGKTFLAVHRALRALYSKEVNKIVLTRPAVEAGEKIGFLPGDLEEKVDPYLQPLFDAMEILIGKGNVNQLRRDGILEVVPIAFMRGRTLREAFIILDEGQNCTFSQLVMLLTRIGDDSRCIVTGDVSQTDLHESDSGLADIVDALIHVKGIAVHEFTTRDVTRHPLVARIVEALEEFKGRPVT